MERWEAGWGRVRSFLPAVLAWPVQGSARLTDSAFCKKKFSNFNVYHISCTPHSGTGMATYGTPCGAVLRIRIRIHRIHVFLGFLDPDPDLLVRGMDPDSDPAPDPSIIKQK